MQYSHRKWIASTLSGTNPEVTKRGTIKTRRRHRSLDPLPRFRTPPNRHLTPSDPQSAPLGQMLSLGNESLMDGAGQHRDALVPDLVAEVLTGEADGTRAGRTQDIHIQGVPLLRGQRRASSGHHKQLSTPVLVAVVWVGQVPLPPVAVKLRPTGLP
jgi:hypothetical protein